MADAQQLLPKKPDDTPPRNRIIAMYTALAVLTLGGLKFLFDSYFDSILSAETEHKVMTSSRQVETLREHWHEALTVGPMPVDRAMDEVAEHRAVMDVIRPQPSHDLAAKKGWDHLPAFVTSADVHVDLTAAPPAPTSPAGSHAVVVMPVPDGAAAPQAAGNP